MMGKGPPRKINFLLKWKLLWQGTNRVFLQTREKKPYQTRERRRDVGHGRLRWLFQNRATLSHKGPKGSTPTPYGILPILSLPKLRKNRIFRSVLHFLTPAQSFGPPVRPSVFLLLPTALLCPLRHSPNTIFLRRGL